jgi:TetR/AcrR family transcriptional regulator, transcriptional repressor for nem operon
LYGSFVRTASDTAEHILDVAQFLVQTQGFNGFSYADISKQLEIRNAAVHYHYPSKAALGKALVRRYRGVFSQALAGIDARISNPNKTMKKLEQYVGLFQAALEDGLRLCLCGMLASELMTLPEEVQAEVRAFFVEQQSWLSNALESGRQAGVLRFTGRASTKAEEMLALLEGAMLLARGMGTAASFRSVAKNFLSTLEV